MCRELIHPIIVIAITDHVGKIWAWEFLIGVEHHKVVVGLSMVILDYINK